MKTETTSKQTFSGVVVSDKMTKTVVVAVKRFVKHPKYGKFLSRTKKYKAHDEQGKFKVGEKVTIEACAPVSKDKHFRVIYA